MSNTESNRVAALAAVIRTRYDECPPNRYPTETALANFILRELPALGFDVVEVAA